MTFYFVPFRLFEKNAIIKQANSPFVRNCYARDFTIRAPFVFGRIDTTHNAKRARISI